VTPVEVAILSIQFPLPCVIMVCVFICHVHVQPAVLGGGGMGECRAVLLPINTSPVYFTYKCSSTGFRVTYTVNCYTDDIPPPPDIY
jgi:hypothetical protein